MTGWLSHFESLGVLDWLIVVIGGVSIVVGLVRGFVFECLSLAGWIVAWFGAQWVAPALAPHLPVGVPGGGLNHGVAFVIAFVLALIVWALLSRLVRLAIQASPLSVADRLLGGAFGAARALVLLLALATVVSLTPAAQSASWRGSAGARGLTQLLLALKPLLPEPAARLLPG
ncbi:MAG: CvpA family protein [Betaproteobacteria bacterium]|jgi:membrane protein required for colicin V production|nr:CvpA family protein [Betaproteobacteria bacterium]MCC6247134.1 CvpA family protein [Rubrivivax sp.]MCL4698682.1 CvpA family protein [Burkholderiaceae bacterium]